MAIEVSGLREEEVMEKDSIVEEAGKFLQKIGKPDAHLLVHVKSSHQGKGKKEYHVKVKLNLDGKTLMTSTPEQRGHRENWDLHMGLKEVLDELKAQYEKHGKRHHKTERPEENE